MVFNDFPRGLPYKRSTVTNVKVIEFENGVEQRRDLWGGLNKKVFQIEFKVNTKAEIMAIHDFYVSKVGPSGTFSFTCPIDDVTYNVRFVENTFDVERRFYNTYFGRCRLVEVF